MPFFFGICLRQKQNSRFFITSQHGAIGAHKRNRKRRKHGLEIVARGLFS